MEEVVSLPVIAGSTADVLQPNDIKKEFPISDPNSHGKHDGARVQLLSYQIKSEAPDMKFEINSGDDNIDIKLEPFAGDELHIKDETDESPTEDQHFDGDLCNSKFTCNMKLQQHLKNQTKANLLQRNTTCNYGHLPKDKLQQLTNTGQKPLKCGVCDDGSAERSNLQRHMRTHTGEKPFKCSVCDFESAVKRNLQRHMRSHTGEKPFKCSVCDYESAEKDSVQRHMRTHTGEKPFKCGVCDYRSVRKSNVKLHMKTHTGEKPFKCSVCDYACAVRGNLQRHNMRNHTAENPMQQL